jgi:hypothetical protein
MRLGHEDNHHFVVVYRRAVRDPGHEASFWFGHITHVAADQTGLETTQKRFAFKNLDEVPAIMRRCIGPASCNVHD